MTITFITVVIIYCSPEPSCWNALVTRTSLQSCTACVRRVRYASRVVFKLLLSWINFPVSQKWMQQCPALMHSITLSHVPLGHLVWKDHKKLPGWYGEEDPGFHHCQGSKGECVGNWFLTIAAKPHHRPFPPDWRLCLAEPQQIWGVVRGDDLLPGADWPLGKHGGGAGHPRGEGCLLSLTQTHVLVWVCRRGINIKCNSILFIKRENHQIVSRRFTEISEWQYEQYELFSKMLLYS